MPNLAKLLGPSFHQPPLGRPLVLQRIELVAFAVISLAAFWKAGELLGIPPVGGFSSSVLQHDGGFADLAALLGLLILLTAIFSLPRSRIASDAPLACAAIGLGAVSWRGGPMRDTLIAAQSSTIFLTLTCELVLLFAGLVIARCLSTMILGHRWPDGAAIGGPIGGAKPRLLPLSIFIHAVITGLLVIFFARSDAKAQVTCAILIASAVASVVCASITSEPLAATCWLGPLLAGVVGYLSAWQATPADFLHIGMPGGFAPLARALPLDWAAFGTVGSIVGYWIARDLETANDRAEPAANA